MRNLSNLFAQMSAMMNDLQGATPLDHFREATWQPPVDIYEGDSRITIVVELPGVEKKNIDVDVVESTLRITGFKQKPLPEATRHVHQMEIPYGQFARFVRLPCQVDVEGIEAEYRDGYLTVHVPRSARNE